MNRSARTKRLTLHKESLRRLTRELREHDLARVLGGTDNGGGMHVPIPTETDTDTDKP
ncbi:MAG TPA: hypothetical protein VHT91_28080 [Kofleriaceae bacterium]|jgi:hypothetical protein|nr:hypothetical protein [Kofleriaceae bacterium]